MIPYDITYFGRDLRPLADFDRGVRLPRRLPARDRALAISKWDGERFWWDGSAWAPAPRGWWPGDAQ